MTENNQVSPELDLLTELPAFESFLNRVGFKRIDGAVYGLLVITDKALSSDEIEQYLGLSQSAISNSLKTLAHYNAVDFREDPENKRIKLHYAKEDSLEVIASLFRKREQLHIEEFKAMAKKLLKKSEAINGSENNKRNIRLKSIILSCEIAEAVIKFVISVTQLDIVENHPQILKKFPKVLDLMLKGAGPLAELTNSLPNNLTDQMKSTFTDKLKEQIQKINESRRTS
jgi:DNA-binding transcriptional regulator GbsR (MarR family)